MKALADTGRIDNSTLRSLRVSCNGTKPPLFYGAAKLHKPECPLRPIVSTIGSATYRVAREVNRILTPYNRTLPSFLQNSEHFVEELANVNIAPDEVMVSFDVKSLFTGVPIEKAKAAIREQLAADDGHLTPTDMTIETIMTLVDLCMISNLTSSSETRMTR